MHDRQKLHTQPSHTLMRGERARRRGPEPRRASQFILQWKPDCWRTARWPREITDAFQWQTGFQVRDQFSPQLAGDEKRRYCVSMFHIALYEPEIPPNTGNIARSCAAVGARLHLIGQLGFSLSDKAVRRAGLDYWPAVDWVHHPDFAAFRVAVPGRIWAIENPAPRHYTAAEFRDGDCLLFGRESTGLPPELRAEFAATVIDIPMPTGAVRSLNLSVAAGVVLFEALRQVGPLTPARPHLAGG